MTATGIFPGRNATVRFTRQGPTTGRDDARGAPTFTPTVVADNVNAAVGLVADQRHEQGAHGGETERQRLGIHVPFGTDAKQGDVCTIISGTWAGDYHVAEVHPLAIHLRVLVEVSDG